MRGQPISLQLFCTILLLIATGLLGSCDRMRMKNKTADDKHTSYLDMDLSFDAPIPDDLSAGPDKELELWLEGYVTKDFLLGKVQRTKDTFFCKVTEEHTERNIYLLQPVYEAYIKMYEAALADGVKLLITSGHRTYVEQVCEWELRWNNPRNEEPFTSDVEKAKFVLQYRSMPGTSRHHWGTDIDLNSFHLSYFETKEGKKMYAWLNEHAHKYGFHQPYTALGENRPFGYQEEKWHWSYRPIASFMLTKYLDLVNKEDIKGFKGDQTVKHLDLITYWVCGIDKEFNSRQPLRKSGLLSSK